jgi:hypothetical protein
MVLTAQDPVLYSYFLAFDLFQSVTCVQRTSGGLTEDEACM